MLKVFLDAYFLWVRGIFVCDGIVFAVEARVVLTVLVWVVLKAGDCGSVNSKPVQLDIVTW